MHRPTSTMNGLLRRYEDVSDGFFVKYAEHGSPFDIQLEDEDGEDVMAVNGVHHCSVFYFTTGFALIIKNNNRNNNKKNDHFVAIIYVKSVLFGTPS